MNLEQFILENSEPGEIWKDLVEYEDYYLISTHGRIISKERKVIGKSSCIKVKPVKFLKISLDVDNRKFVTLRINNTKTRPYLGLLMAKTFLQPSEITNQIRFKDGNPLNCNINNIEWAERRDTRAKYDTIEPIEGEIWKEIPNFENLYAVSNKGRVKSLDRNVTYKNGRIAHYQEKLLAPIKDSKGYLKVHLKANPSKHYFIHRLVALVFIENPNNYPNIDHIDTNPLNNCVENLRWVTQEMNMNNELTKQHLSEANQKRIRQKRQSWNCKPVVQLKNGIIINTYSSIVEASDNGFNYSCIQKCLSGKQGKHKGFTWMYLSDYQELSPESVITPVIPSAESV